MVLLLCVFYVFYLYSPQTGFGTSNGQVWPPLLDSSFSGLSCWTNITGYSVVRCMLSPWDRESGSVQLVTLCSENFHIILQQLSVVTPYQYSNLVLEANYPSMLHMICLLKVAEGMVRTVYQKSVTSMQTPQTAYIGMYPGHYRVVLHGNVPGCPTSSELQRAAEWLAE